METVSIPMWIRSSAPASVAMHTACPVSKIFITSPSHGAAIFPSVGSTAIVVPSISDANVSSATSAVGTTVPFTGLVISSTETVFSAEFSVSSAFASASLFSTAASVLAA